MTIAAGMDRALALARLHLGHTAPNPAVGAVLIKDGAVIGEGSHTGPGFPHAEAAALDDARARGFDPRGATLFVTLEPCCHEGAGKRTPPCAQRLIREGVAEVYAAVPDPNPRVRGRGMALLADAGVRTHWGPLSDEGRELIADFSAWVEENRPFITLKWAQSLDAKIAGGPSRWITGDEARAKGRELRARHDAVAVGAGTLRADNPQLTVRDGSDARPRRLVFAGKTPLPEMAEVFNDDDRELTWVVAPQGPVLEQAHRLVGERVLEWNGAAAALGPLLLSVGFRRILVEGGTKLIDWFLGARLWDQAAVFVAPRLLGEGLAGPGAGLSAPLELARIRTTPVGGDVLIEGWNPRCPAALGVGVESEAVCSPA
jgi:diaminohydroxyphosphoribosylaminopyrimidine deaminase/5-amino-6-(5-phosphoribosylamino)uracil reductase